MNLGNTCTTRLYKVETKQGNEMIVIGLLSTKEEADEIKFIIKVCSVKDRIHFIVNADKLRRMKR
jgi:hypothetical protein